MDFGELTYQPENTDIHEKQVRKAKRFYRWMDQGNPTPDRVTYKIKKIEDTEKRTTKIFVRVFAKVPDGEWKIVIFASISKENMIDKKLESFGYTTDFTFETNSFVRFPFMLIYNKGNPVFDFGGDAYLPEKTNIYDKQIEQNEYLTRWQYTTDGVGEFVYQIQSVVKVRKL